jgi:hypothetical protein
MRGFFHPYVCALRDLLGIAPPNLHAAIQRITVDEDVLRAPYAASALAKRVDDFVLYRIIGNDLPPRHEVGQSLRSLEFILENEPSFAACTKKFVVNRVLDPESEGRIIATLEHHGLDYVHIPFDGAAYAQIPLDFGCLPGGDRDYLESRSFQRLRPRHKIRLLTAVNRHRNNYVMHNNGARNAALGDGQGLAKWVLPFDGNCFFTESAWWQFKLVVEQRPWFKYLVVPMARIQNNADLLDPGFAPAAEEEPQVAFRCDAQEVFNEAFPYGRFPKIELFWRLGVPGNWSYTVEKAWDPPRRGLSPEAYQFALAGWVARLDSGVRHLEQAGHDMGSKRGDARREAILDLLERLDREYKGDCEFSRYRPVA